MQVLGPIPQRLIKNGTKRHKFYNKSCKLKSKIAVNPVPYKTLWQLLSPEKGGPNGKWEGNVLHNEEHYKLFANLLEQMLDYNPETRIKPLDALSHPFFQKFLGPLNFPSITIKPQAGAIRLCLNGALDDPQDTELFPDVSYIRKIVSSTEASSSSTKESRKMTIIRNILSIPSQLRSPQKLSQESSGSKEHQIAGSNYNSGASRDDFEETKLPRLAATKTTPPWPCESNSSATRSGHTSLPEASGVRRESTQKRWPQPGVIGFLHAASHCSAELYFGSGEEIALAEEMQDVGRKAGCKAESLFFKEKERSSIKESE